MQESGTEKPLIVQGDGSLLLDVHSSAFDTARAEIAGFAELEKSPEHMHTYRLSSLSLWNAATAGLSPQQISDSLSRWSRYPVPENITVSIRETLGRYGKVRLLPSGHNNLLLLTISDEAVEAEIMANQRVSKLIDARDDGTLYVRLFDRGTIKQELMKIGYPVEDDAPLVKGEELRFSLRDVTASGYPLVVRDYQRDAASAFYGMDRPGTGFGTVVMPCGSGKTLVGMAIMEMIGSCTLIITTNVAAVHQWVDELQDKSTLGIDGIGEYTGDKKEIRPVTVATYQILTWRPAREADFPHFQLFRDRRWGLIIYDEVHLLPAPVFRVTAEIQAVRRLGLTATLVREDGKEDEVFSLVGPKRYDVPWKELETKGWIAEAYCHEIRVDLPAEQKVPYAVAEKREKFRIASENRLKVDIARQLVENHSEDSILVIGHYLNQLAAFAQALGAPLITGKTPNVMREKIYREFRQGTVRVIVVSKVANFAIDLPDASVAIQISGTFGSRQEEAQRLGRILRPKKKSSFFYSLVSRYTSEESFATKRQKFLTEQGYKYRIEIWDSTQLAGQNIDHPPLKPPTTSRYLEA